jgi:hypothetical protein
MDQVEVLREAQRLLADLTGGDTKQSAVNLWARAVEVEIKIRAALAAAERVAGEDDLKAQIKQLMDDNGYTANELGKAQDEIKRLRDALAAAQRVEGETQIGELLRVIEKRDREHNLFNCPSGGWIRRQLKAALALKVDELNPKICGRCGVHIDSLRPEER